MGLIRQARDSEVSLLQSAIDKIVNETQASGGAQATGARARPKARVGIENAMVHQAAVLAHLKEAGAAIPDKPPLSPTSAEGAGQVAAYCAGLALKLAKAIFLGDDAERDSCKKQLEGPFTTCDSGYIEAAEQCALYFKAMHGVIPYVQWLKLGDYVYDKKADGSELLPSNGKIGIIGDWGTGQERANQVLAKLAGKNPDVVVHLGDIYYSGVDHEAQGFFFDNWCKVLGLKPDANRRVTAARPRTFSIPGNHDMYSGGAPYYVMIQQLGHSSSYFCLRNQNWQFIAMDTGYNDHGVFDQNHFTTLRDTEVQWVLDKIQNNPSKLRTVLLSHHQPFSANDSFQNGGPVNTAFLDQLQPALSSVDLWLWGHEHDMVIFKSYQDVQRGRCVGHGAYPVGRSELADKPGHAEVPLEDVKLTKGSAFYDNGYALIELNGATATVKYFAVHEDGVAEDVLWIDDLR